MVHDLSLASTLFRGFMHFLPVPMAEVVPPTRLEQCVHIVIRRLVLGSLVNAAITLTRLPRTRCYTSLTPAIVPMILYLSGLFYWWYNWWLPEREYFIGFMDLMVLYVCLLPLNIGVNNYGWCFTIRCADMSRANINLLLDLLRKVQQLF